MFYSDPRIDKGRPIIVSLSQAPRGGAMAEMVGFFGNLTRRNGYFSVKIPSMGRWPGMKAVALGGVEGLGRKNAEFTANL